MKNTRNNNKQWTQKKYSEKCTEFIENQPNKALHRNESNENSRVVGISMSAHYTVSNLSEIFFRSHRAVVIK